MRGRDVFDPWPIPAAGDMIEISPSDEIVTHGLNVVGDAAEAGEMAPPSPNSRSTKANESPAAPIMRALRVTPTSEIDRRSMIPPPATRVLWHARLSSRSRTGRYARSYSRRFHRGSDEDCASAARQRS